MDFSTKSSNLGSSSTSLDTSLAVKKASLGGIDIAVVVLYLVATLGLGIWASRRSSRDSLQGYFLASRDMFWLPVGASVFVSNIGAAHFVGLAGTGAASGIAVGSFEWFAIFLILQMGWVFVPIYLSSKVFTMPEYIYKRYGGVRLRVALSVLSLLLYVLTKIAVDLYAGALFIQQAFNINLYLAITSLLVITGIYTILGGLKAVIYTDAMQTVVLVAGGAMLTILGFQEIGGYENLEPKYMEAIPQTTKDLLALGNATSCGIPRSDSFHLFRDIVNSDHPWTGMLIGIYLIGTYYFCTDQVIIQRLLAAKNVYHAKAGCVLAGFLKILPMYMMVMIGMVSRILFPNEVACADPTACEEICGNPQGCSNIAYPKLVLEILPDGLRGIMVAAVLSAMMSSLTSIFNSTSTIFTIDVWKRIRKGAPERELLIVGMVTVCVLIVISIAWVPILLSSAGGQLFIYINMVLAPLGSAVTALFLLGILWPRVNEKGAFWGLMCGIAVGVVRLVFDFTYPSPGCDQVDDRPWIVAKIHYLHYSPIVFSISCAVMLIISYCSEKPQMKQLLNTTWFTMNTTEFSGDKVKSKGKHVEDEMNSKVEEEKREVESELLEKQVAKEKSASIQLQDSSFAPRSRGSAMKACNNKTNEMKQYSVKLPKVSWGSIINALAIILTITATFLIGLYA